MGPARVQDPEALKDFRIALLKFSEKATSALGEAEAEVHRVTMWLENEQTAYWSGELRRRQEGVSKCREALRFKQIFKSSTGGKNSTIDEEKALAVALRRVAEAEQKCIAVKKWIRQLHRESHQYRGAVQRLATTVAGDVPQAAAKIYRMLVALDKYFALKAPDIGPAVQGSESAVSMGDSGERVGYAKHRQTTPSAQAKDKASPGDPAVAWTAGEIAPGDAERLDLLPVDRDPPDSACAVLLAEGVQTGRRIYLERSAGAFPGDSGWYIGPADDRLAGECRSLRVGEVLGHRPELAKILSLPVGSLVVIDSAGIAAVLNAADQDVWASAASIAVPAPAEPKKE